MARPSSDADAALERIRHLEERLARAKVKNRWQPELARAIQIEAHAYRRTLDREQAAATRDSRPEPGLDPVSHAVHQLTERNTAATGASPARGARDDQRARGTKVRPSSTRARRR